MTSKAILLAISLSLAMVSGSVFAQQPALIDRELFFGNPEYADVKGRREQQSPGPGPGLFSLQAQDG